MAATQRAAQSEAAQARLAQQVVPRLQEEGKLKGEQLRAAQQAVFCRPSAKSRTHESLLRAGGLYAELYRLTFSKQEERHFDDAEALEVLRRMHA